MADEDLGPVIDHSVQPRSPSSRSTRSIGSIGTFSARTSASSRVDVREVRRVLDRLKAELDRERLERRLLLREKADEAKRMRADFEKEKALALAQQAEELERSLKSNAKSQEPRNESNEVQRLRGQLRAAQKEIRSLLAEKGRTRGKEGVSKKNEISVDPILIRAVEMVYKDVDRKLRRLRAAFEGRRGNKEELKQIRDDKKEVLSGMSDLKDNLRQMASQLQAAKKKSSDDRIKSLENAVDQLRQQNDELRSIHPVEVPMNRLKQRNQELASLAKELESRARSLEHSQRYQRADSAAKEVITLDAVRREFELKRARDIADHARAMQDRDRELKKLRVRHDALREESEKFSGERGELEDMLRSAQRERLLLEKQLALNKDILQEPASRRERINILTEKLKDSEEERDKLQKELVELQKKARRLQYYDSTVLKGVSPGEALDAEKAETSEGGEDGQSPTVNGNGAEVSDRVDDPLSPHQRECNALRQKLRTMEDLLKHLQEASDKRRALELQHWELRQELESKQNEVWSVNQDKESIAADHEETIESMRAKLRELEKRCELQALKHEEVLLELEAQRKKQKYRPLSSSGSGSVGGRDIDDILTNGFKESRLRPFYEEPLTSSYPFSSTLPPGIVPGRPGPGGLILPTVTSVAAPGPSQSPGARPVAALASPRFSQPRTGSAPPQQQSLRVYVAKYNYNPHQCSPNENPDLELSLQAGDYIIVHGDVDEDGFLVGEMIDGKRGLVPSNFVEPVNSPAKEKRKIPGRRDKVTDVSADFPLTSLIARSSGLSPGPEDTRLAPSTAAVPSSANGLPDVPEVVDDAMIEAAYRVEGLEVGSMSAPNPFPPPRRLAVDRMLSQSVLISWAPPEQPPPDMQSFHIYVDEQFRSAVKVTEKTKALVEKLDANRPHRLCVRAVYPQGQSKDAECTLCVSCARQASNLFTPTQVKASRISDRSAKLSWVPGNSSLFHSILINGREVRLCPPGQYKAQLSGLEPDTIQRVLIKARRPSSMPRPVRPPGEDSGAYYEFRTLPGGGGSNIQAPSNVQVEAGPQDGTLLITWNPVASEPQLRVRGYAICINGRCVEEANDPQIDHCLLNVSAIHPHLGGSSPEAVLSVRTIAADGSHSNDCEPLLVLSPGLLRQGDMGEEFGSEELSDIQEEEEEDLIERERQVGKSPTEDVYVHEYSPLHPKIISVPEIHITRDRSFSEEDLSARHYGHSRSLRESPIDYGDQEFDDYREIAPPPPLRRNSRSRGHSRGHSSPNRPSRPPPPPPNHGGGGGGISRSRGASMEEEVRVFVALFDYDPATMSPNPDAVQEELPFREGQLIKIFGERDADGFYHGECDGHRGLVPCNMVGEVDMQDRCRPESPCPPRRGSDRSLQTRSETSGRPPGPPPAPHPVSQPHSQPPRQTPSPQVQKRSDGSRMKRMLAIYDYDPQSLSPNVDGEDVELSFRSGDLIYVYGDMDEDGFYTGELPQNGQRGLVPSNFLREITPDEERLISHAPSPRSQRQRHSSDAGNPVDPSPRLTHNRSFDSQRSTGSPRGAKESSHSKTSNSINNRPMRVSAGSVESASSLVSPNPQPPANQQPAADKDPKRSTGQGESPPPPLNPDEMPIVMDLTPTPAAGKGQKPRKKQSIVSRPSQEGLSENSSRMLQHQDSQSSAAQYDDERKRSVFKNPFKKNKK